MVSGPYTTWTTCSRHNTSQVTGTNILLRYLLAEPFGSCHHESKLNSTVFMTLQVPVYADAEGASAYSLRIALAEI